MKKIIFVIPTLRIGGAEKSLVTLLKTLDPKEVKVDLLLFEAGGPLQRDVPEWINIIEADILTRGMTLEIRYYLKELLKARYYRAAIVRLWMTALSRMKVKNVFHWGVIRKYIKRQRKKYDVAIGYLEGAADFYVKDKIRADRKIGWIHSDFTGRGLVNQEKQYYEAFDRLVTISEKCKTVFKGEMNNPDLNIEVIENIALPDEIRRRAEEEADIEWDEDSIHIVTVGRIEYAKGIDIGAQTCRLLQEDGVNIKWHVFGDGSLKRDIENYISTNQLHDMYMLEGQTENPYPYMKRADLIVQPSRWEGKSVVLDEAKILGKAIVTTNYPSVGDQITDGVNGIVTECVPEALAEGILKLIRDPDLKREIEQINAGQDPDYLKTVYKVKQIIGIGQGDKLCSDN